MNWDAIVIGLGGVGSSALHAFARRGLRVLGLEARGIAHALGSSHGQTRLWRRGYYEHPDYVPLVDAALRGWRALEAETGARLVEPVELLQIGPPSGSLVPGTLRSAAEHGVAVEELEAREVERRYRGALRVPDGLQALSERGAHLLWGERCVATAVAAAERAGARVQSDAEVRAWRAEGEGFTVETTRGKERSGALAIAAGPWAGTLLRELGAKLDVRRKPVFWFEREAGAAPLPALFVEQEDASSYYAFPLPGGARAKAAEHSGGDPVADPSRVAREELPQDRAGVRGFLERFVPGWRGVAAGFEVCLYTMSPDGHFFVDRHPEHARLAFAAGLSGHGFKFSPALGELLAGLALGESQIAPPPFLALR
ncbi:MAG: N-methyl-L-tryptophan oxidase [Planctomycetes bacterium]|nr:N-methyl-L-tryptophan oxidase [Planctomycetota bacterium]